MGCLFNLLDILVLYNPAINPTTEGLVQVLARSVTRTSSIYGQTTTVPETFKKSKRKRQTDRQSDRHRETDGYIHMHTQR